MPNAKSTYYRLWTDGDGIERLQESVFPSDGDWAATYAARGWSLTPPSDFEPEDDEDEEGDGLDDMKMPELKAQAGELGIPAPVGTKKVDLIASIRDKLVQLEAIRATQQ